MPIYEYRCPNGHRFEVLQSMTDDPVSTCEECDAPVERVFHPVAVHFKGSGFYTTDYAKKGSAAKSPDGAKSDSKSDSKGESGTGGSGSGDSGKSESKSSTSPD